IIPVAPERRDYGVIPAEDISDGKQTGNNRKAAVDSRSIPDAFTLASFRHQIALELLITPIGVEPPRTRAPRSTVASVPAGQRTSKIERKMLSFVPFPTRSIRTTRPSAGETITRGSAGISRSGLRKKNATNAETNSSKIAAVSQPSQKLTAAAANKGGRNLNASLTI